MTRIWDIVCGIALATTPHPEALLFVFASAALAIVGSILLFQRRRHLRLFGSAAVVLPILFLATTSGLLTALVASTLLALVAWLVGLAVLARLDVVDGTPATHALAIGLGSGAIGFAAFGLGLVSLLNPVAIAATLGTLALLAGIDLRRTTSWPTGGPAAMDTRWSVFLAAAAVLVALGVLPYVMAPEVTYDAVFYHLALVKDFLSQHSVAQIPSLFASNFPIIPQLTYASATALSGELDAGKIVHLFVGLGVTLSIYALAARLGGCGAGFAAVLVWLSAPLVLWEMSTAYVDLFWVLYAVLSILAALLWVDSRRTSYAVLAAAFLALGLGVKVSAAFQAIAVGVALLLLIRSRRDFLAWVGSAIVALTLAAPWYIRSYILTGNPVFPFLNGIFRSPQWEPVNENFNFGTWGVGSSPVDLLLTPLRLVTQTNRFGEMPDGALGVVPLMGAIGLIGAAIARDRRLGFVALSCVVGTALWFASAQYGRYLLPVLAVESVLIAVLLGRIAARVRGGSTVLALALAGLVGLSFVGYVDMLGNVPGTVPWPVVLGKQTRDAYLSQALRHYLAYRWLATHAPSSARILGIGLSEWPIAYSDAPVYIAHMTQLGRQILSAPSEEEAQARLTSDAFDYVVIDYFPRPTPWHDRFVITRGSFINDSLRLVYGNNYVYVYEVATPAPPMRETLRDVDLRQLSTADGPWQRFGTVPTASEQCVGARIGDRGGFAQSFDARPDTLHVFQFSIRALGPGASGKLQVNWLGQDGSVTSNIEIYPVSGQAETDTMASTSPANVRQGIVYLSGYGGVDVCVERASALTPP